jgi:cell shape-determining protein MreC
MGLAALCLFLPPAYTRPVKNLAQFFVPIQDLGTRVAGHLAGHAERLAAPEITGDDYRQLAERARALENRLVATESELRLLQQENRQLALLKREPALAGATLIPARIVAQDPVGFREPLLVSRGRANRVREGDYVASRMLVVHGRQTEPNTGAAVIGSEYLVGRISQTGSLTARVLLFSDVASPPQPVRIGRLEAQRFLAVSRPDPTTGRQQECDFVLTGRGDGSMVIEQVPADYIEAEPSSHRAGIANPIRAADLVVTAPTDPALPSRMVIGRVVNLHKDPRNPLIYNLEVRCPIDPARLQWVYIIDMSSPRD